MSKNHKGQIGFQTIPLKVNHRRSATGYQPTVMINPLIKTQGETFANGMI